MRGLLGRAAPFVLCAAGLCVALWPTLSSGFALVQSDPGDTRHLNYVLETSYRWLLHWPGADIWNPPFFFPQRSVGGFTETLLGNAPFYALPRLLGAAPDTAFQLWTVLVLALDYAVAYLWLRGPLKAGRVAAALGAFLFAFGSSRLNQLNHQHLLPQFYSVVAVHALMRWWQATPGSRWAVAWLCAAAAAVVAQLFCAFQLGWFLGFALLCALVGAAVAPSARAGLMARVRGHPLALPALLAIAALSVAPLALGHLHAAAVSGFRTFDQAQDMLPRVQSWFYLGPDNWLYGWTARLRPFRELPMEWEQRIGLGLTTTGVLVWSCWREPRGSALRWLTGTLLALVLLTMLYRWRLSPWAWVFRAVPGANSIRAVSRVGLLALIPAAAALARFVDREMMEGPRWLAALIVMLVLAEQGRSQPSYDKKVARGWSEAVARQVRPGCRAFFYSPPATPRLACESQLDAMWASLEVGVPTINGYSSNFPPDWHLLEHAIGSPADADRLSAALSQWTSARSLDPTSICWVRP